MPTLNESAQTFRQLATSEEFRPRLCKRLDLVVEPTLPKSFTELLAVLDQQEAEMTKTLGD
ncbi:hypothetical protein LB534_26015 [Mesorhizobium sp. CA18]|uniref:hypothetical protein n=1 Tax=unclassified Mesorhizobium TaxID=325217 RepID=UPI001CCDF14A|nr:MULTISPECIES: hypothetical protein [unclassified Mesorhizobium]MBZ9734945.1 hypothetical protein [Mesorhizobium sp. CA9]MBZ9828758.1 hypothetical protein [Mesorhizobium sp. CA18]MBZ9834447.1 hypothetical protein [Mesorhizobium sp. CA2]MBZ9838810.1 hypothetical protein [Mesorhizobium sp. CA3]MBZ9877771.1 hypothetical protein [Mesorhizobium sp. Ca11]